MRVYRYRSRYSGRTTVIIGGDRPTALPRLKLKLGRRRLPDHKVRIKCVTLTLTNSDREYLDLAARRHGITICRMVGDLVENAIKRGYFDELVERRKSKA